MKLEDLMEDFVQMYTEVLPALDAETTQKVRTLLDKVPTARQGWQQREIINDLNAVPLGLNDESLGTPSTAETPSMPSDERLKEKEKCGCECQLNKGLFDGRKKKG